jgi:hypothetical protein
MILAFKSQQNLDHLTDYQLLLTLTKFQVLQYGGVVSPKLDFGVGEIEVMKN